MHCESLPPAIQRGARILILGSMPGIASLRASAYYAHPQNRFWPMLASLLAEPLPAGYEARLAMLSRHKIALWDAITACEREGSLDAAIQNEEGADIGTLLETYPSIQTICCNGAKSYAAFTRYNKSLLSRKDLAIHALPSTSPANARWSMEALIGAWGKALAPLCAVP